MSHDSMPPIAPPADPRPSGPGRPGLTRPVLPDVRPDGRSDPAALLVAGLLLLVVAAVLTSVLVLVLGAALCLGGLARAAADGAADVYRWAGHREQGR